MIQKSYKNNTPSLYLVPTPIGNMEDITIRGINILNSVDFIFSEDTRTSSILLKKYQINKKLIAYHKFNEGIASEEMLKYLKEGKNIALISDRGTPLVSDPGYTCVSKIVENNFNVIALPGANALLPALVASGLDTNHFLFYGFLNNKESIAKKELESLKDLKFTIIFYESPHRLSKTLQNIYKTFGNRNISISREISKLYEEVFRGNIEEATEIYKEVKGEIVIVVDKNKEELELNQENLIKEVENLIKTGITEKDSIKGISKKYSISKNMLYNLYQRR